jgi:glycosyltransferase involved in cell wall biosynthesis
LVTDTPRIAVIMPAYNRAATIRHSIDSVLAQTEPDFELVIVDDGSTDGTADVIAAIADPRIKLLIQPRNMGGNAARNRGIRESTAALVSFIDSDDQFLPHKLEAIISYFGANPGVEAVIDSFELQYPETKGGKLAKRINADLTSSESVEAGIFDRTIYKATPAISARRSALERIAGFDETLRRRQDMDLALRLAEKAEIRTISQVLWRKHWSPSAISAKQETFLPALLEICERHPQYISNPRHRKGLSRDVARHLLRLIAQGKPVIALKHTRTLANKFGTASTMKLVLSGLWEMIKRLSP